jgi:hypothetical protein
MLILLESVVVIFDSPKGLFKKSQIVIISPIANIEQFWSALLKREVIMRLVNERPLCA